MNKIDKLLEKLSEAEFSDQFKSLSDEELKKRIREMDVDEIVDEIDDILGDFGLKNLAILYDAINNGDAEQLLFQHLDTYVEMLIENEDIEELQDFFFKATEIKRLKND